MMRLEVLGSWAGSPGAGSACSGYLLAEDDTKILFDCGPGVVPVLQEHVDPDDVSAIFISHMHADHSLDLLTYAYRLIRFTWRGMDLDDSMRIPLYLPPGGMAVLDHLLAAYGRPGSGKLDNPFTRAFDPRELEPEEEVWVGDTRVVAHPVNHPVPAYGYRAESPSATFGYSGDTALCKGLGRIAWGADMLLCDASGNRHSDPALLERGGHLSARQAGALAEEMGVKQLVLTHLSRQDPEWVMALLDEARSVFTGHVEIAATGLVIPVAEQYARMAFLKA